MNRLIACLVIGVVALSWGSPVMAQEGPAAPVSTIALMTVELWPDYDRPELLVLMTGSLPLGTSLPATVSLPLPAGATVNAVARLTAEQQLIDDIAYEVSPDEITITLPTLGFRVEYYVPLAETSGQRLAVFDWQSSYEVRRLDILVEEPRFAEGFVIAPEILEVRQTAEGRRFHALPPQTVPAGVSLSVNARYELVDGRLTAANATGAVESVPASEPTTILDNLRSNGWLLAAGGGTLLVAIYFLWSGFAEQTTQKRPSKPQRRRAIKCSSCGHDNQEGDRFCRSCGQPL